MDQDVIKYKNSVYIKTQRLRLEVKIDTQSVQIYDSTGLIKIGSIVSHIYRNNTIDFILSTRGNQGRGYMMEAFDVTLNFLFRLKPDMIVKNIVLSHNIVSQKFHRSFGFTELDDGDIFEYTMDAERFKATQEKRSKRINNYIDAENNSCMELVRFDYFKSSGLSR